MKPDSLSWLLGLCLLGTALASVIDGVLGSSVASLIAAPLLLIYLISVMPTAKNIIRVFFVLAVVTFVIAIWVQVPAKYFVSSVKQMVFLAGLLSVLGMLRISASRDVSVLKAGEFLSVQPPSRRYLSLNAGGHVFGVLLNLGGLGLLLDMTMSGLNKQKSNDPQSIEIFQLRKRRMASAVMRGFATIALWTPFGIALNTMVLVIPGLHWIDIAGWGFLFAVLLSAVGLSFDIFERRAHPPSHRPEPLPIPEGGLLATFIVIGHVLLLGFSVIFFSRVTDYPFQSVLITLVAIYAMGWSVWQSGIVGISELFSAFMSRAATFSTEIGVFSLSGFMGLLMAQIVPVSVVIWLLGDLSNQPFAMAMALMWISFIGGVIGIHPMISVTVLAGFLARIGLGDLTPVAAGLSILSAWACLVTAGPFVTTAVFTGSIVEEKATTVALKWNGLYSITAMLFLSFCLWIGITFQWF